MGCTSRRGYPVHRASSLLPQGEKEEGFRFYFQTSDVTARSRGAFRPSFSSSLALSNQRAQGKPGADCTRGLVCQTHSNRRTRAYRFSRNSPAFPAQWFYGLYRALPGERACLPPSLADHSTSLAPASRRQDHTTSPYALAFSSGVKKRLTPKRPPHSGPTHRDDRETPLGWAGMGEVIIPIFRIVKRNIFDSGA